MGWHSNGEVHRGWVSQDPHSITTLWVGGMPAGSTLADLLASFCQFGSILNATVGGKPAASGDLSGFVRFSAHEEVELALKAASSKEIRFAGFEEGRDIKCQWSKSNCFVPGIECCICLSGLQDGVTGEDLFDMFQTIIDLQATAVTALAGFGCLCFGAESSADEALNLISRRAIPRLRGSRICAWSPVNGPVVQQPQRYGASSRGAGGQRASPYAQTSRELVSHHAQPSREWVPQDEGSITTVWVGGIPMGSTVADLVAAFCHLGRILNVTIGGRPAASGDLSGFIRFASHQEAEIAIAASEAKEIILHGNAQGRDIKCKWSKQNCHVLGMDACLCLGGLHQRVTTDDLKDYFGRFGNVSSAAIGPASAPGPACVGGIAVVCFELAQHANEASHAVLSGQLRKQLHFLAQPSVWNPRDGSSDALGCGGVGSHGNGMWTATDDSSSNTFPVSAHHGQSKGEWVPQDEASITTVWVGGIPMGCSLADLIAGFCRYGRILSATLGGKPAKSGDMSGFVRFASHDEMDAAIAAARQVKLQGGEGRDIKCQRSRQNCYVPGIERCVCLKGLKPGLTGEDLAAAFNGFGELQSAAILESGSVGALCFSDDDEAEAALSAVFNRLVVRIMRDSNVVAWRPAEGLVAQAVAAVDTHGAWGPHRQERGESWPHPYSDMQQSKGKGMHQWETKGGKGRDPYKGAHDDALATIWVGGIPAESTLADLLGVFCIYGRILNAALAGRPAASGDLSGFVRFASAAEAEIALAASAAHEIIFARCAEGRDIKCQWSRQNCHVPGIERLVCVGGMTPGISSEDVLDAFSTFGDVESAAPVSAGGVTGICFDSDVVADAVLSSAEDGFVSVGGWHVRVWHPSSGPPENF